MSTRVSEKPVYTDFTKINLNEKVEIIKKQFTKYEPENFGTYSTDDTQFLKGTLTSNEFDSTGQDGSRSSISEYKVKLDDSNEEIVFKNSPLEYYFKINPNPNASGGKKSRRKRNIKKSRKNRRKSKSRHR